MSIAVMHAVEETVVATNEQQTTVQNVRLQEPDRHTGGGHRFTGGLGYARANGWEWDPALASANACAAHSAETGTTGTVEDIRDFLAAKAEDHAS